MTDLKSKIKEGYILAAIIIALAALAVFIFFKSTLPKLDLYRKSAKEASEKEKELSIRKATIAQVNKLKKEIGKIDNDYKDFTKRILLESGTFEAVKVITDIAKGLDIEFLLIQPLSRYRIEFSKDIAEDKVKRFPKFFQKEGKKFYLWEVPVTIKIKTKYTELLEFIKRIEDNQRFLKIKSIVIDKDYNTPLIHQTVITISIFSLPAKEAASKNEKN